MLEGRKILLGATGGIALYKACGLVRELIVSHDIEVRVVMTESATKFITPLVFETLSGNEVWTEMFPEGETVGTRHVEAASWADAVLVCPATANIIGKAANGIADDLLSTIITSAGRKTIFVAAMETGMYENPIVQANRRRLIDAGFGFIDPEEGALASGATGVGRMAKRRTIIHELYRRLGGSRKLESKKVIVTAGPTREWIDPVRFISNPSSGKMGYALAEAASSEGADVTLISGPSHLEKPPGVKFIETSTPDEMCDAVLERIDDSEVLIMAAAVGDFQPESISDKKIKKGENGLTLNLVRTRDILKEVSERAGKRTVVGFSVETDNIIENSKRKLKEKSLDLIVANEPSDGFGGDTNRVTIISADGKTEETDIVSKRHLAHMIIDRIAEIGS